MERSTKELLEELGAGPGAARLDGKIEKVLADHYVVRPRGSGQTVKVRPATHTAVPATTAQRAALVGRRCVIQQADEIAYMSDILSPESGSAAYRGSTEPGQVVIKAVTPTPSGFWVEWYPLDHVDHYEVWVNDTEGGLSPLLLGITQGTTWLIPYEDSQGYVAIRAIGEDGEPGETSDWAMCDDTPGMPLIFTSELRREGHHFSWHNQSYTYTVRIYRDDEGTGEPTNKVWEGFSYGDESEASIPYDAAAGDTFFCATAVGYGGSESLPTAWIESDPTPPMPTGFTVDSGVGQVLLKVNFALDSAHTYPSFREFVAWMADDSSGTNAQEIGRFSDSVWPTALEMGTQGWFAILANSWAEGKESERTDWVLGQSLRENSMQDDFSLYGGNELAQKASAALWCLQLSAGEADENWQQTVGNPVEDTTNYVEGMQSKKSAQMWLAGAFDFSQEDRFGDSDYVYHAFYVSGGPGNCFLYFTEIPGANVFIADYGVLANGWHYKKTKKSDFAEMGDPDWANIDQIWIQTMGGFMHTDDLRVVKADPDDATVGNDTGDAWNFSGDFNDAGPQWHVYGPDEEGVGAAYSLGQIKDAAGAVEYLGVYTLREFNSGGDGFTYIGRVMAFKDDGKVGLTWMVTDITEGAEDGYVAYLDTAADKFYLQKVVDGSYTSLATEVDFTSAPDTWYWIAIKHQGNDIKVYLSDHPGVLEALNLRFAVTDATWTQGKVGVWTQDSKARFTDLMAGSPQFSYKTYMPIVVAEGAGYAREDYVPATNVQGARYWYTDTDPTTTRQVRNGDFWIGPTSKKIQVRISGAWVECPQAVSALDVTALTAGSLDVASGIFIWDDEVLNLDFTGTDHDTPAEMLAERIRIYGEDTPFPARLGIAVVDNVAGSWAHSAGNGWAATCAVDDKGPAMLFPIERGHDWEFEVEWTYTPSDVNNKCDLVLGYMSTSGHCGAEARLVDDDALASELICYLTTNDGIDTGTDQYTGVALPDAGDRTVKLRAIGGCQQIYDPQDSAWHDYEGRCNAGRAYTADYLFLQVRKLGVRVLPTIYLKSLKFTYLGG